MSEEFRLKKFGDPGLSGDEQVDFRQHWHIGVERSRPEIPSLISESNGELHEFEVRYVDRSGDIDIHTVPQSKSIKNALASFSRAVPGHGRILGIRKVVAG